MPELSPVLNAAKSIENSNPLIGHMYCADPTAIEYEGRLYVYGTNDHQQYLFNKEGKNTYEKIKSLVIISTDDMVNWTYHGTIETGLISPYIVASWAPSIVSRVEEDGKTHFYLYYSNSGWGVGVLTSTSPTGPWTDPIRRPLVDGNTKGIGKTTPFDPGAVIDDNGVGWLAFGGSFTDDPDADYLKGGARIVKLGGDMISLASDFIEISAPYHFEANELNFINGTYIYTYNTSWKERAKWELDYADPPTVCCMSYMTSNTPLDPGSWVYRGNYFKNPGDSGFDNSNNHTHLHKYKEQYYLFYHTLALQKVNNVAGGFRNISADKIDVDENTLAISMTTATVKGIDQIKKYDPYTVGSFATYSTSAGITFQRIDFAGNVFITAEENGGWTLIRGVDFRTSADNLTARLKGNGRVELRLDDIHSAPAAYIEFKASDWKDFKTSLSIPLSGEHDLFFIFSEGVDAHSWYFK